MASEEWITRPTGYFAVAAGVLLVVALSFGLIHIQREHRVREVGEKPPQLTLSATAGDQTGVLKDYIWDRGGITESFLPKVPPQPLIVEPREWLRVSTRARVGLPIEATVRYIRASELRPCFKESLARDFACVDVDIDSMTDRLPVATTPPNKFGFAAPEAEGIYQVSLECWWPNNLGGGRQVFLIDVQI